jgi:short-subunit dehydrogenase
VAEAGYRGLEAGRRVVVPGFGNRLVTAFTRFVPRPLLLNATDRHQQGRQR